jgi:hypothetical protein
MDIANKDFILIIIGFALNIVASAIWTWWTNRSEQSKQEAKKRNDILRSQLNSNDIITSSNAFRMVITKSIYWFVVGNVMFCISGFEVLLNLAELYSIASVIAASSSLSALIFFMASIGWLRLYFRLKENSTNQSEIPPDPE